MSKQKSPSDALYLFKLDIMIRASSNGAALEQLLHALNNGNLADYRIESGVQLGAAIEQTLADTKKTTSIPIPSTVKEKVKTESLEVRIHNYIQSNQLIRLNINKGRGVKMNIPCRVINFEASNQMLTVYHVDEKQVYTFLLNEIDDFIE
jgi:hypothetical protein